MYIDSDGNKWFRGNLHTHTRRSDGHKEPDEVFALYAAAGYDFIALTDHWKQSEAGESDRIFTLSGIELDTSHDVRHGVFHIVGIGMDKPLDTTRRPMSAQQMIDAVQAAGGAAILAHPAWSLNTPDQVLPLTGITAFEMFNSISDVPHNARPYSGAFADMIYSRGDLLRCTAADDTHFYDYDLCRSYIWLKAEALTRENILAALANGDFYATQGPEFSSTFKDGVLTVRTTPARRVVFFSDSAWSSYRCAEAPDRAGLTTAEYPVGGGDTYVRFEVTDFEGRSGWSNPIFVREIPQDQRVWKY